MLVFTACASKISPSPTYVTSPSTSTSPTILPSSSPSPEPDQSSTPPILESTRIPTSASYRNDFPDLTEYVWKPVVSGLDQPVDIQNAGDGSGRLFVVEKSGQIRIFSNGLILPDPFLEIQNRVGGAGSEQGLLGMAFHPDFSQSGTFFVYYTDNNGNTVISRFQISRDDPNRADPGSELILLQVDQPFVNHNGGGLAFGPDGYLYIGLGDGGSGGDPFGNGQNLQTLLGKLLRIDVNSSAGYTIPPDNPFTRGGGLPEIWAYGLRNPWRFSFDRLTGDLFIGDVGQNTWEEVDFVPAGMPGGLNFGWNIYEGLHPFREQASVNATFIWPVAEYTHSGDCSVTGGNIYRGSDLPDWQGIYLFGDYCSGKVFGMIQTGLEEWQSEVLFLTGANITTFGVDEDGEIYLANYQSGTLLRLSFQ